MIDREIETEFGVRYEYIDGDNKVFYDITSISYNEFEKLSIDMRDFEEINLIDKFSNQEIKHIVGMDWSVELGEEPINLLGIFRMFEKHGQEYAKKYKPEVIYYRYDDERMHLAYEPWILEGNYELLHLGDSIAIYYREIGK